MGVVARPGVILGLLYGLAVTTRCRNLITVTPSAGRCQCGHVGVKWLPAMGTGEKGLLRLQGDATFPTRQVAGGRQPE